MKNLLFLLAIFVQICTCFSECSFPPSLWCSSPEIAKQCKVTEQCSDHWASLSNPTAAPVKFTLYMESLCPDCKQFISSSLWPAYKQVGTIMDLQIVPYGNAHEKKMGSKWQFQCQHGSEECTGNVIETCAINILKNVSTYFPFIHCIEASEEFPRNSAPVCAQQLGINYSPIEMCSQGVVGNLLEHKMAQKTDALQPAHNYVPWVTLNGVHNDHIQEEAEKNLVKLICDSYKGKKPSACKNSAVKKCQRNFCCPRTWIMLGGSECATKCGLRSSNGYQQRLCNEHCDHSVSYGCSTCQKQYFGRCCLSFNVHAEAPFLTPGYLVVILNFIAAISSV